MESQRNVAYIIKKTKKKTQ